MDVNENDLTNLLRVLAISNAGLSKHESTLQEAKKRFWSYIHGNSDVLHPNLRSTVFNIVLAELTNEDDNDNELTRAWEAILKIYQDESLPSDQRLMALVSLGYTRDATLIDRYMAMALDDKQVRSQDIVYIYSR